MTINNSLLDMERIPKELLFLLDMIKSENIKDINSKEIELAIDFDWNLFLKLAMHHRLFPLLNNKLKNIDTLIPDEISEAIHNHYKKNIFLMLHLSAEMEQVSRLFADRQIPLLVLKGPVLATDLYGDLSLRTCGDLDVLVPIHELERAEEILIQQGYKKDDYIQTILNDWKWRHHHITFFHPKKKIKLEIHWRLNPGPSKEPRFEELWNRKRKSTLTSGPVFILGKEDLFLFLVSHGARHGWSRLRWLFDIHQLTTQNLDWRSLVKLLKKYQFLEVGGQALILTSQLLKTPLGEESEPLLVGNTSKRLAQKAIFYLEKMVNLHTDPVPKDVASYHKRYLFSLMTHQQKFFFILSFLHPYPEDAHVLPLPKSLHFLYFPLRPVLWIWRKTRKSAMS